MYDGIAYRGFAQSVVEELARFGNVPVWNALTNEFHPTQILADVLTIREHCARPLSEVVLSYLGDARFNMGNSLLMGAAKLGMELRIVAPRDFWPSPAHVATCRAIAQTTGARLVFTEIGRRKASPAPTSSTPTCGCRWASPSRRGRSASSACALPGQPPRARGDREPDVKFLHCLPAFHDEGTEIGRKLAETYGMNGLEVTHEVFESPHSIVFDQAENRLHTIKAILVATLAGDDAG